MIYIASPYTSPLFSVIEDRVAAVTSFTANLIAQGVPAFSPIVYFHPIATALGLKTDAEFWHRTNMAFLRHADAVFVLQLPGWENSQGVKTEIAAAKIACIPIVHFGPDGKQLQ